MRVFRRRSKNALLAKSLQHGFPAFCLPKRKAPAGYAGANFHLMKLQIILQARSFLSPLFGSESQAALLSVAQSAFRLPSAVLPADSWTGWRVMPSPKSLILWAFSFNRCLFIKKILSHIASLCKVVLYEFITQRLQSIHLPCSLFYINLCS